MDSERYLDDISKIESLIEEDKEWENEVQSLLDEVVARHSEYVDYAFEYAEPGYSAGEKGILFADWNSKGCWDKDKNEYVEVDTFMPRLAKVAEHAGYEIEWSDEWGNCSDCQKAFRVNADSYLWKTLCVIQIKQ